MKNVVRWVGATGVAALAGLLLFGAAGMYSAPEVEAQSPPAPPATFAGSVTVDGAPAEAGAVIQARIGSANCGTAVVYHHEGEARYNLQVPAHDPTGSPNCGTEGATVSFYVDGVLASPTAPWIDYDVNIVNLTVTTPDPATATPTPTATTAPSDDDDDDDTTPATSTPTTAATPKPPATGAGVDGGSSTGTLALLAVLVIGIGAFGAAGAAAARRK